MQQQKRIQLTTDSKAPIQRMNFSKALEKSYKIEEKPHFGKGDEIP